MVRPNPLSYFGRACGCRKGLKSGKQPTGGKGAAGLAAGTHQRLSMKTLTGTFFGRGFESRRLHQLHQRCIDLRVYLQRAQARVGLKYIIFENLK